MLYNKIIDFILGGNNMEEIKLRKLDMNKIRNKKHSFISSSEALADITPFEWSDDVLSGKKKVIISHQK